MIPRIIIQTGADKPRTVLESAAIYTVRSLNPDFEYKFYNDRAIEEFILTYYPTYFQVYKSFAYNIQRVDFFRYLAIYHFGGFYLDLDVLLARSLDDLTDNECVFSFEALTEYQFLREEYVIDWEIANYAFGASPKHPFLKAILENCIRSQMDTRWLSLMLNPFPRLLRSDYYVLCSTGPGLVTRTIAERKDLVDCVTILFPNDVCDRNNWRHFSSFGIHLAKGNWRKDSQESISYKLYRFFVRRWFFMKRKRMFEASMQQGPRRSHLPIVHGSE
jgi:inositol phosphorylceramide mannosyltransferase catalytic subunit